MKTHRDIYERDIETNQDAIKMFLEKFLDGHDDDEKKNIKDKKVKYTELLLKMKQKFIEIPWMR